MKPRMIAKNIKVKFNGHTVTLPDENDRRKTPEGVEIWMQQQPANNIRPMASCPDGSLDKFKHCRPEIVSIDWEAANKACSGFAAGRVKNKGSVKAANR